MASTPYTYNYPADFPSLATAAPSAKDLITAIAYTPSITIALEDLNIGVVAGVCEFIFVDPLPAPDEAALDAIVAAHTGITTYTKMESSSLVVGDELVVTEDATWQFLAEIITTPTFFTEDLSTLFGRIVGAYTATLGGGGEKPQLQVVEVVTGLADEDKISPPFEFDAAASWTAFGVSTDVDPRPGYHNKYRVYARLNGAAALSLRWTTMSMIHAKVVTYS